METTQQILLAHRDKLDATIADRQSEIDALRVERENTDKAIAALPASSAALVTRDPTTPIDKLTIKNLVVKALDEVFPNGATANQLLDHFQQVWNRSDVIRTSLSPQLTRLKVDEVIERDGFVLRLKRERPV